MSLTPRQQQELNDDLMLSVCLGNPNGVREALAKGANPNVQGDPNSDRHQIPALVFSASVNDGGACLRLLLEAGADVDTPDPDNGVTPLMEAANHNRMTQATLLLEAGADVLRKSRNGETALDRARRSSEAPLIRLLEAHQARQALTLPEQEDETRTMGPRL